MNSTDVATAYDHPDCGPCQEWREAGASWPRPCRKHYEGEPKDSVTEGPYWWLTHP